MELGGRAGGPEDGPGRRLRRGHPALQDGGSDGEEAERREGGAVRRAACAEPICGAESWEATMVLCPTADGASTPPHGAASAGHGGSQTLPIKWAGGCGIGWARRRTGGRLLTAAGSGAATRPFQKTAAIPARRWSLRGWSGSRTVLVSGRPGWWSRALCRSRARGKSKWGGRSGDWVGAPEDRRPAFSRPQASARPPGLFKDSCRPRPRMELARVGGWRRRPRSLHRLRLCKGSARRRGVARQGWVGSMRITGPQPCGGLGGAAPAGARGCWATIRTAG